MSSQSHHLTGSHATQSSSLPVIPQDYNASQSQGQSPGEAAAPGRQEIPVQPVRSMLDVDDAPAPAPAPAHAHTTAQTTGQQQSANLTQQSHPASAQQARAGPGQQHVPELRHETRRISGEHHAPELRETSGQYKIRSMLEDLDLNDPARGTGSQHPYTSRHSPGPQEYRPGQQEHGTSHHHQRQSSEEHNTAGYPKVRSLLDVADEPASGSLHQEMKRASEHYAGPEQTRRDVQGVGSVQQTEGAVKRTRTEEHDQSTTIAPHVTHETIQPVRQEIREERITREIHTHEVRHLIQPVIEVEVRPARHWVPGPDGKLVEVAEKDLPFLDCSGPNQRWAIQKKEATNAPELSKPLPDLPTVETTGEPKTENFRRTEDVIVHKPVWAPSTTAEAQYAEDQARGIGRAV